MKQWMKKYWQYLLAFILVVIGSLLLLVEPIQTMMIQQDAQTGHEVLSGLTAEQVKQNDALEEDVNFDFSQVEPLSLENVAKNRGQGGRYALGEIVIPDLDMKLPIFKGVSNYVLSSGAGTMKPNQKMGEGNYALASHNYFGDKKILFSPLVNAKEGMKVYLTDMENIYVYTIQSVKQIHPTQVEVIEDVPNQKLLTLITCTDLNGTDRYQIMATLTEKVSAKEASENLIKPFDVSWTNGTE